MVRKISGSAIISGTVSATQLAQVVNDQSNTIYAQANTAYGQANTARNQANTAYGQANSAYGRANTSAVSSIGKQFLTGL